MTKIVLTRHGHVEGISPERFRGRMELALTDTGHAEAAALATSIARRFNPVAIYTSPLERCVQTGAQIAAACGAPAMELDELNDLDYGEWQWRTHDEVRAQWPELYRAWLDTPQRVRFPQGDSLQDLISRTADALRFVLDGPADHTVVLVGHDSVNRALLMQLLDQPLSAYWTLAQAPCCINEIDVTGSRVQVQCINDTAHLGSLR